MTGGERNRDHQGPRYVIVNGDDVGLCGGVNKGALAAVRARTLTSISVLVGPGFGVDLAPFDDAGVSVGLHLNLTLGDPCAAPGDISSLLDGAGRFITDREAAFKRLVPGEAAREMNCQLNAFRQLAGEEPSHLDSHKHVHLLDPRLFRITAAMARELDVPLRARDVAERAACLEAGVKTTDWFLGAVRPAPYWTEDRLVEQLGCLRPGTTELMCHPGVEMETISGLWYLKQRETEARALLAERVRDRLAGLERRSFRTAPLAEP
jgi:predicted glycoside hydrolase/deacetylase ChbG (UPF0249 family)